uniref:(northern house mosquito) hypothetical protein n=1 Tax=Culex pipiens TaxID=7175 RepID=A0A8D8BN68_CULPI
MLTIYFVYSHVDFINQRSIAIATAAITIAIQIGLTRLQVHLILITAWRFVFIFALNLCMQVFFNVGWFSFLASGYAYSHLNCSILCVFVCVCFFFPLNK